MSLAIPRTTPHQRELLETIAKAGTYYVGRRSKKSIEALVRKGLVVQVNAAPDYLPLLAYSLSPWGHSIVDRWEAGRRP